MGDRAQIARYFPISNDCPRAKFRYLNDKTHLAILFGASQWKGLELDGASWDILGC